MNTSRIAKGDIDNDGDQDILIGGFVISGKYPEPEKTTLLINTNGIFSDETAIRATDLLQAGIIKDVQLIDFDKDDDLDIIVAGEWTVIKILKNIQGTFSKTNAPTGLENYKGWWNKLTPCDPDNDGDIDFIAGNLGLNTKYKASFKAPFQIHYDDFDQNGSKDIVLGYRNQGKDYPVRGRSCSAQQIPVIANQFPTYNEFSKATLTDVFGEKLTSTLNYKCTWMSSSYIGNNGDGTFKIKALPNESQLSTCQGIQVCDVTGDGLDDIVLAGNLFDAEIETCRHDASIGLILKGNGKGKFTPLPHTVTGLFSYGNVKDIAIIKDDQGTPMIIVGKNNGPLTTFSFR